MDTVLSRKGQRWSLEEDNNLLDEIAADKTIREISVIHQRTENAIILRSVRHAEAFIKAGGTNEEACDRFNISKEMLEGELPKRIPVIRTTKPKKAKKPKKPKKVVIASDLSYRETFDKIEIIVRQLIAREKVENPALTSEEISEMLQNSFDEIITDILHEEQD